MYKRPHFFILFSCFGANTKLMIVDASRDFTWYIIMHGPLVSLFLYTRSALKQNQKHIIPAPNIQYISQLTNCGNLLDRHMHGMYMHMVNNIKCFAFSALALIFPPLTSEESGIHIRTTTTTTMHAIRPISHTVPCDQNNSIPQYSIVCTVDDDSVNKFLGSKVNYDA